MSEGAADRDGWVMWEARAAAERTAELLSWVLASAVEPAQVYVSADRVVAIYPAHCSATSSALAKAPPQLLARPADQWEFERVR